jgi:hypothetical protein
MEVVVMRFSGSLKQRAERGMGYPFQPPVSDENFQVPIDRRLIERCHDLASVCKNLVHSQWPFVLPEDLLYGCSLCRIALQVLNLLSVD